jgi:hypothetical protein
LTVSTLVPLRAPAPSPSATAAPVSDPRSAARVAVTGAALGPVATGEYTVAATVTSALGAAATAAARFAVRPSGEAPVINIVGPQERTYYIRDGFKITTALVPESVCDGAKARRAAPRRADPPGGAAIRCGPAPGFEECGGGLMCAQPVRAEQRRLGTLHCRLF